MSERTMTEYIRELASQSVLQRDFLFAIADRIEGLEADNASLRDLIHDIDKVTIWESGHTPPDTYMQQRIEAALELQESNDG
tara:strand:- start:997 stop:1242 length:246 start_codon:yes stop_codon:yes gene_type:complete